MPSTVLTGKGCVVEVKRGLVFGGVHEFKLVHELETITFPAGESWASYSVPVGMSWRGEVAFRALDAETLRFVLGGSRQTGRLLEVRDESQTIPAEAPHTVTLSHADVVVNSEEVSDAAGRPFTRSEAAPAAGEYSIDGDLLTFNAADAGRVISLSYLRLDETAGDKLIVNPDDLPARFALYGVLRGHDTADGSAPAERYAVYLADCQRVGEFKLGAAAGSVGSFTVSFIAHNRNPGDVVFYLPPTKTAAE